MKTPRIVTLVLAAVLLLPATAWAGDDTWSAASSGYFHVDGNWTDGTAPTADDTVEFGVAGTYQVRWGSVTGDRTTQSMSLSDGDVAFRISDSAGSPYTWTITDGTTDADATIAGGTLTLGLTDYTGVLILDIDDALTVDDGGTLNVIMGNQAQCGTTTVGFTGTGSLTIEAGGLVSNSSYGYLGYYSGSTGTATVMGTGSKWTNSSLYVGRFGNGTLNIEAGGQVRSYSGYLGYNSGSTGTATVMGTGSKWTNSSSLYVGRFGNGTLNIEAGGQVSNTGGYLGYYSGSTGTATVTGTGSKWTNSGSLYVGRSGNGTLTVADGGLVTARTLYASPSDLLGDGTITVQGAVLDADLVFDGTHGTSQTLSFGTGGTLNLSVTSAGTLGAGYKGTGTLRIADGVTVTSAGGYVGYHSGSTGTATVTGTGSTWTNSSSLYNLYVGQFGNGTLNIEAGGQVSSNSYAYLGYGSGSTGTATVTGTGSKWTNRWDLDVGYYGNGTLNILDGGQVSNTSGYLGYNSGSTGTATVMGTGSKWTNSGSLYVGDDGTGTLNIEAGGQVSNTTGYLGRYSGSNGTATVDGTGSLWSNTGSLYVGGSGAGSVTVQNGGQLTVGGTLKMWKADSAVTVSGGTLTAGALAGSTGTIRITDPVGGTALTVGSGASDTFSGSILDDTGPGSLTKVGSGTQTLGGANTYTGATTVSDGTLLVNGDQSAATGAVTVASGATLGGSGIISGAVTINAGGTLSPGASAGTLTVGGDLAFADGGNNWVAELFGADADRVDVTGTLTLGDDTALEFVFDGANPFQAGTYTLASYDTLAGTFSSETSLGDYSTGVDYGTGTSDAITIEVLAGLLPGDANLDRTVDLDDFARLRNNFSTGDTWAEADFNGDYTVDLNDFAILRNNFGSHVPEPATLLLMGAGLALAIARKHNGRRD